jgi:hypothetical protein
MAMPERGNAVGRLVLGFAPPCSWMCGWPVTLSYQ